MLTTLTAATVAAHAGPGWGAGFGWLFFLIPLFWIGLVALIIGLATRHRHAAWREAGFPAGPGGRGIGPHGFGPGWNGTRSAEATLAERFAQGDIDEVEYRARLEVLRANR
ncbi:hypothetical protein GCM10022198_23550 [Klugiella xanthotipulae]|uniref:Putative membrane protein n=1 Tax=Klugiella xanthotipulae TaxID=244735 RepID=A0A543I5R8_9MICO|nr:SHOCT domain-containing protein [Klugiella xanthotipulae]TQM65919.1 putative membrane protein [Klugiella xanthotipulae]